MSWFNILYTHQKTKKAKVWQDGKLCVTDSSKRIIYDERRSKIDTLFSSQPVLVGDDYETDKYLITVDSEMTAEIQTPATIVGKDSVTSTSSAAENQVSKTSRPTVPSFTNKLAGRSRKGFNAPKRIAVAPPAAEEPVSKQPVLDQRYPSAGGLNLFSSYSHNTSSIQTSRTSDTDTHRQLPGFSDQTRSEQDILQLISSKNSSTHPAALHEPAIIIRDQELQAKYESELGRLSMEKLGSRTMNTQSTLHTSALPNPRQDKQLVHVTKLNCDDDNAEESLLRAPDGGSLWNCFMSQQAQNVQSQTSSYLDQVTDSENGKLSQSGVSNHLHNDVDEPSPHSGVNQWRGDSLSDILESSDTVSCDLIPQDNNLTLFSVHLGRNADHEESIPPPKELNALEKLLKNSVESTISKDVQSIVNSPSNQAIASPGHMRNILSELKSGPHNAHHISDVTPKAVTKLSEHLIDSVTESPQVACFSLGSLPTFTDDELSQNSGANHGSPAARNRLKGQNHGVLLQTSKHSPGHQSILNDGELGRTEERSIHIDQNPNESVDSISNHRLCSGRPLHVTDNRTTYNNSYSLSDSASDMISSNSQRMSGQDRPVIDSLSSISSIGDLSSVTSPGVNNLHRPETPVDMFDFLRDRQEDQNNTSLFDLDDSFMRPTPIKQTDKQATRHKWSMFSSPPKSAVEDQGSRSMFDINSPDMGPSREQRITAACVINNTPESLSEFGAYRATKLLPPSNMSNGSSSLFSSKLPAEKIQQARSKFGYEKQQTAVPSKLAKDYYPLQQQTVSCTTNAEANSLPTQQTGASILNAADKPMVDCWTLRFPSSNEAMEKPTRSMSIPINYKTTTDYKQTLEQVLREQINIILLDLSQRYHELLSSVEITDDNLKDMEYHSADSHRNAPKVKKASPAAAYSGNPRCKHGVPSKMVTVKKEGKNKGRMFYACGNSRDQQCKFFEWADKAQSTASSAPPSVQGVSSTTRLQLSSPQAVEAFYCGKSISFYCAIQLTRRSDAFMSRKWNGRTSTNQSLYLRLNRKEKASTYTKDDLWVVSQSLKFDQMGQTFLAKSAFYGPNCDNELELTPIAGYSSSNWPDGAECHAIHAANVSTELVCLSNLKDLSARTVPILPWIIHPSGTERRTGQFEVPTSSSNKSSLLISEEIVSELVFSMIDKYTLNPGQADALRSVAAMFQASANTATATAKPICLIKGVFGAGKSYLLSVVVQFIASVLEIIDNEGNNTGDSIYAQSKILVASMTNVAVDRILLSLLDQGYTNFLRVGSLKKIAKPILSHSMHSSGNANTEMRELQDMLKNDELSLTDKQDVRKSISQHKSGLNKQRVGKTRVIGVTCAACSFPVLDNLSFKVVLLDECSQMTEPLSLLPIKRAACSRLVLVGDPRQLRPTIQSSESTHEYGLEQTMFDRLSLMGVPVSELVTQYRCHPAISSLCRDLFYGGKLEDGITADQRKPLVNGLPPVCLYNVLGHQKYSNASFYNDEEAVFACHLIQYLLSNGVENHQIGVITLYKAQVYKIQSALTQTSGYKKIQVATVDSFQGAERDIIILSSVRTAQMGFVDDVRRTNVALSRGKHHLFIIGHVNNLRENSLWSKVVSYLEDLPHGVQSGSSQLKRWKSEQTKENVTPKRKQNSPNSGIIAKRIRQEPDKLTDGGLSPLSACSSNECTQINAPESSTTNKPNTSSKTAGQTDCIEDVITLSDSDDDISLPLDLSDDEEFLTQYQKVREVPNT